MNKELGVLEGDLGMMPGQLAEKRGKTLGQSKRNWTAQLAHVHHNQIKLGFKDRFYSSDQNKHTHKLESPELSALSFNMHQRYLCAVHYN